MLYNEEQLRRILNSVSTEIPNDAIQNEIGVLTENDDLSRYGAKIIKQPYIRNAFTSALVNQFVFKTQEKKMFTSAFDIFRTKGEGVAYGSYDADVNPIMPVDFDLKKADRILDFWDVDVKTQYFAMTRQQLFPMTITKDVLKQAFVSYENLDAFMQKLIIAPRNGNTVIEFNTIKELINANFANNAIKRVSIPKITKDNASEIASLIQNYAIKMCNPSSKFNAYADLEGAEGEPFITQSDRRDLVFIGSADAISQLRTHVLALSFNKEDVDFNFTFCEIDDFGYDEYNADERKFTAHHDSPIEFIICDGGFLELEDNLEVEFSDQNIMTLGTQSALHVWQTVKMRAWRNALAFYTIDETISIDKMQIVIFNDDESQEIELIPNDAEIDIKLVSATYGEDGYGSTIDDLSLVTDDFITVKKMSEGTINVVAGAKSSENKPAGVQRDDIVLLTYDIIGKVNTVKLLVLVGN